MFILSISKITSYFCYTCPCLLVNIYRHNFFQATEVLNKLD